MTLGSVATSALLVGGMMLGIHLLAPPDQVPGDMTVPQGVILGMTVLLGCFFPIWVPETIGDRIDRCVA